MLRFVERFLNEHPAVTAALLALAAALFEAVFGVAQAMGVPQA